jgi:hypothetical protein
MNSIAADNFGTTSIDLLRIRADAGQSNRHVSPVIYKIRDDGPAILDGEFYKDKVHKADDCKEHAALPGKASALTVETAVGAPVVPVVSQLPRRGVYRAMIFSIVLLTVALVSVGFYAYEQKLHVNDLQAELKIYDDLNKDF